MEHHLRTLISTLDFNIPEGFLDHWFDRSTYRMKKKIERADLIVQFQSAKVRSLQERRNLAEEQIFQVVDGLLEMVGVGEMRYLLPSDLSTGRKRSVAIARALASQPECILYDEPTTMVDPLMGQLLGDLIQKLKYQLQLTSIVVTHDMRFAQKLADRVVFLHQGKAVFFGTIDEMATCQHEVVREFLELDQLVVPGH